MRPRLSLSVSWPSSAARGSKTASAAAMEAIRRSKSTQGEAVDRQNQADRSDDRHDLCGGSPCRGARARESGRPGLGDGDQGGVERVSVRPAHHVGPRMRLELAGDPDELQAVLRRQQVCEMAIA